MTAIVNRAIGFCARHAGVEVGKVETPPGGPNSNRAGGVETEEPHARFAVGFYVSANVDFRERGESWDDREEPWSDPEFERDNSNPSRTFERVDFEFGWNKLAKLGDRNLPVREQQV